MTEIKKTLEILKARWPEVTFIIGLGILSRFSNELLQIVRSKTTTPQDLLDSVFSISLIAITMLFTIGFQRTFCTNGSKRQSPIVLLRTGIHFFWRMIGLGLIYVIVIIIMSWLTFLTVKQFISIETSFSETSKASPIVYQLFFTAPMLILIKPILLILPLIVVLDCRLFESFRLLKLCRLRDAKELIIVFLISIAMTFLWVFLPSIRSASTAPQYILVVGQSIAQHFIGLMMVIMAVRFVASQKLVYDNGTKPIASQDSLRYPI